VLRRMVPSMSTKSPNKAATRRLLQTNMAILLL
jgi:hypothetical protein